MLKERYIYIVCICKVHSEVLRTSWVLLTCSFPSDLGRDNIDNRSRGCLFLLFMYERGMECREAESQSPRAPCKQLGTG